MLVPAMRFSLHSGTCKGKGLCLGNAMDHFHLRDGELHCEDVPLAEIAAAVGTPVYVYSTATMVRHAEVMRAALAPLPDPLIAYAVKANPNAPVLATLARPGLAPTSSRAANIAARARAGIPADKIVFSGVGKTESEMAAALEGGLYQFNLESDDEAEMLSAVRLACGLTGAGRLPGQSGRRGRQPCQDLDRSAENKFGIPIDTALAAYRRGRRLARPRASRASPSISAASSPASSRSKRAFARVGALIDELRAAGHTITVADLGGGLGVPYDPALPAPPSPDDYGAMVRAHRRRLGCPAGVRARAADRRQCRRILLTRDPGEAGRDPALPDRRRGDERSDAARALRCLARDRGGRAERQQG